MYTLWHSTSKYNHQTACPLRVLLPTILPICAGASAIAALALAAHYPLGALYALPIALACLAYTAWRPESWLLLIAALPLVGFAPWTGWITFEELDILVLAAAAGGYAHWTWIAWQRGPSEPKRQRLTGPMFLVAVLCAAFALSLIVSMARGFADAGGFVFGWFQGYHEPMNSVRQGKPFFLALLMLPLWLWVYRRNSQRAAAMLLWSLVMGLLAASLAAIWERMAFTGLSDFSSDYRTTALFWEMHVGGAALDGFLALTMPWAMYALSRAKTGREFAGAASVLAVATYTCLTTFSRIVYLAIPVGLVVFVGLSWLQARRRERNDSIPAPANERLEQSRPTPSIRASGHSIALVAGFSAGAIWMFQSSGFRGMAALLGATALMLPLVGMVRQLPFGYWLAAGVMGVAVSSMAWAASWLIPKGVYVTWAMTAAMTAAAIVYQLQQRNRSRSVATVALGSFIGLLTCTALVAWHWGDLAGLVGSLPVLLLLATTGGVACAARQVRWPDSTRWQMMTVVLMCASATTVGVLSGGAYMVNRFATGERDLDWRRTHWQVGIDMLRTPAQWTLGEGIGRFPSNYFLIGKPELHPGDYRLKIDDDNAYLTLTGGLHTSGWGEIFRVSQRIVEPGKGAWVTADVRTNQDATLHFEICEKHLLYGQNCVGRDVTVKAAPGVWQAIRAEMQGKALPGRGDWYAPRLIAFSVAMESRGRSVDLDNLRLFDTRGGPLLTNGDFTQEMAHWYFSSDKNHLPWHMKNMFAHVLFEQGVLGASLFLILLAGALWRVTLGSASMEALAPALAAGLLAFMVVGLFDSLLDAPRVAWLFYLLILIALAMPRSIRMTRTIAPSTRGHAILAVLVSYSLLFAIWPASALAADIATTPSVIQVGPDRPVRTLADAARLAKDGTTIEVDAGEYGGDVAVWTQDKLSLKAVGGRVVLKAQGQAAEGKAIWVVRGGAISVQGFDFMGTQVPDRNGAGIRFERGKLVVRDCRFIDNENGILTGNRNDAELEVIDSEFAHNGYGDGLSHNLYVGTIARLTVSGSYFHHAIVGHLIKSRAEYNDIRYNRLSDELGGRASYELEFPNGGIAYVVGNIIAQGPRTENPHLISYGAEGYRWPKNALYLAHNTLVDGKTKGGVLLRVRPGDVDVKAVNNLVVGPGLLQLAGPGEYNNNLSVSADIFEPGPRDDYRIQAKARFAGRPVQARSTDEPSLQPSAQYKFPTGIVQLDQKPRYPGAVQPYRSPARP